MAEGLRLVWTIFLRLTRENLQILATLMVLSSKLEKKIYQTPMGLRASSLDLLYYKLRGAVFRCEISKFVACKLYAAPLPCLVFFHQTITLLPDYTISTTKYIDRVCGSRSRAPATCRARRRRRRRKARFRE